MSERNPAGLVSEFAGDVSYELRGLLKNPAFSVVSLMTLSVGIGANTAIFSFVDGALLKPLPYEHPERIVRVLEKPPGGDYNGISTLNYLDWQKENTVFEYMAATGLRPARRCPGGIASCPPCSTRECATCQPFTARGEPC